MRFEYEKKRWDEYEAVPGDGFKRNAVVQAETSTVCINPASVSDRQDHYKEQQESCGRDRRATYLPTAQ